MSKPRWIWTRDRRPKPGREIVGWYGKGMGYLIVALSDDGRYYDDTGGQVGRPAALDQAEEAAEIGKGRVMSEQHGVRIRCDGCGECSEWATPQPFDTLGEATKDLRATLAWRKWGRSDQGRDLCPLCVRCDRQRGRLVPAEWEAKS